MPFILSLSDEQADLETVGGKGMSLAKMVNAGLPVPDGFHVTTEVYRQFVAANRIQPAILKTLVKVDAARPSTFEIASTAIGQLFTKAKIPSTLASAIVQAYLTLPGANPAVAVRSSAVAEDLPGASFAGQQETYLNIRGAEGVLEAVRKCWASLWTPRAIAYRTRQGILPENVIMAVVVQLLVPAEAAGILFTVNPLTGKHEEMVINAAWGLGEAVVGGVVTPDSITVNKTDGSVIHRDTAVKQVMTVRTNSGTKQQAVPNSLKNVPVLSDSQVADLAQFGMQIDLLYGMPMDIEWALADGKFAIVQARPITALPQAPIVWAPPDPKGIYMRGSLVDLMPDPLSPLFITLGIPSFIRQMQPMSRRVLGSDPVLAEDYFTSINTYAYMNSRFPPRSMMWILFKMLPAYPRLLRQLVPIWRDQMHPEYQAFAAGLKKKSPGRMTTKELWRTAQDIVDAAMFYVCALIFATMGASAGSEMLLTRIYEKMVKREGDPPATTLLMGWDNIPIRAEKSLYDLAMWCRQKPAIDEYVRSTDTNLLAAQLQGQKTPAGIEQADWKEFQARFASHLDQFGHIIFQLDFAENLPLDHPEPMLENVRMFLRGEGVNPYERQKSSETRRIQTAENALLRLKGFRRWAFKTALKFGQGLAEVREDALADIGLGYPKLREMLRELGHRFTKAGIIEEADDIFWLKKEEIDALIAGVEKSHALKNLSVDVDERKAYWEQLKEETPPPMMPMKERVMGVKTDVFISRSAESQTGDTIKGVATSPGVVTAQACVINSPEDFGQMRPGYVLVSSTTTPAWTPLFAMASAVVTDIGGPLSHGSIVAREYGIPAVMGTGVATRRIHDGQTIKVDGKAGIVTILG